jgi:hypothetical protein
MAVRFCQCLAALHFFFLLSGGLNSPGQNRTVNVLLSPMLRFVNSAPIRCSALYAALACDPENVTMFGG